MRKIIKNSLLLAAMLLPTATFAQISTNPYKFLGNITTRGNVEAGGGVPAYYNLWNQITCENESKWSSVEGTRGYFNWGCDRAFDYAKNHGFTYKFHALVWGAQYPSWLDNLSPNERLSAMTNWFNHVKDKYNTLPMIDVVNEAVGRHQQGNPMIKETLGGGGKTGYDWLIKAFEMAYERWPDAILIYNDYNSIQYDIDAYLELVQTLRDAGAPIDAYGNQSHAVANISSEALQAALDRQQNALKMPMYVTELDIDMANDAQQKAQYQKVLPVMWEAPYCAGVTLWGYIHGATWEDNSGLYKNGKERPAMTWIKEYMATDAAKNAVGPLPGSKKEASVYIRPASLKVARGDALPITVRASMATKTIEKIDLYIEDELVATMTEAPYKTVYEVPRSITSGKKTIKAVVTTTDGSTYERYSSFSSLASTKKRAPYNGNAAQLPGTINISEYDDGAAGVAYNNASRDRNSMNTDQWMDYTVDVAEEGLYSFDAEIAAGSTGGMFHLAEFADDNLYFHTEIVDVPKTGGSSNYKMLHGRLQVPLTAGRHTFSLMIDHGGFSIKSITLNRYEEAEGSCLLKAFTENYGIGDNITLSVRTSAKNSTVKEVRYYADNMLIGTATSAPWTFVFTPTEKRTYTITAVTINAEGGEIMSAPRELKVTSDVPLAIQTVTTDEPESQMYNVMGQPVGSDYRGIVIKNGKKVVIK